MHHSKQLSILFTAFATFTSLHAQETATKEDTLPTITLAMVVRDLEQKAKKLTLEQYAIRNKVKESNVPVTAMDKEKSEALQVITQHLIQRRSKLSNKAIPSDPYYRAIQQQLHAGCHLETLQVWWEHCRKGTKYESLAEIDQLPLMVDLRKEKATADQLVADNQPVAETSQSGENQTLDPVIQRRMAGGTSILNQIDGWKDMPETEKSKIISR